MEVVRDKKDNCIIICSIENVDPMACTPRFDHHRTGADADRQGISDPARRLDRGAARDRRRDRRIERAVRHQPGRWTAGGDRDEPARVALLGAGLEGHRLPIAKVAAKLAVGYTLDEISNDITGGATPASIEPTIDYVVTKIPRFAFEKFPGASNVLTTSMKSVGEAMAIGRTFQESCRRRCARWRPASPVSTKSPSRASTPPRASTTTTTRRRFAPRSARRHQTAC